MIVERMATDLGLSTGFIHSLARSASHEYKAYQIRKRLGGFRLIHHPSKRLKSLQRWLLANVIENLPVHQAARAYRKGQSIFANASIHANSRYLLRMDLSNFFPSITQVDIAKYIVDRAAFFSGWTPHDIDVFCKLVCRDSVLTIGAPTSPALSNAICYEMDAQLEALCVKSQVTYTRYADDLFFSTTHRNTLPALEANVAQVITDLKIPGGLKININKTRHSSRRGARRVTGVVLGSDGQPYIGRGFKRKIRALIHRFDTLDRPTQASLAGMIAYARGFDPQFINSLITKYGLAAVRRAMDAQVQNK
jgi:RNA-directed DNA polymerase